MKLTLPEFKDDSPCFARFYKDIGEVCQFDIRYQRFSCRWEKIFDGGIIYTDKLLGSYEGMSAQECRAALMMEAEAYRETVEEIFEEYARQERS